MTVVKGNPSTSELYSERKPTRCLKLSGYCLRNNV